MRTAFVLAGYAIALGATSLQAQAAKTMPAPMAKQGAAATKYHRDLPAKLVREAKITEPVAAATALKAVPGGVIEKMELEHEDSKFIYSYDIKVPGKTGIQEVHVDAMNGAVVSSVHETPADEKAEAARDRAAAKAKAPAKAKKASS